MLKSLPRPGRADLDKGPVDLVLKSTDDHESTESTQRDNTKKDAQIAMLIFHATFLSKEERSAGVDWGVTLPKKNFNPASVVRA